MSNLGFSPNQERTITRLWQNQLDEYSQKFLAETRQLKGLKHRIKLIFDAAYLNHYKNEMESIRKKFLKRATEKWISDFYEEIRKDYPQSTAISLIIDKAKDTALSEKIFHEAYNSLIEEEMEKQARWEES